MACVGWEISLPSVPTALQYPVPDILAPFCPACLLIYKSISPSRGRGNKT